MRKDVKYIPRNFELLKTKFNRPCGAMDNASDYGSEDSKFESW